VIRAGVAAMNCHMYDRTRNSSWRMRTLRVISGTAGLLAPVMVGLLSGGCHRSEDEPIKECEVYASSYDRCLHQLGTGAGAVAAQRAQKLRTALDGQIHASSDAKRDQLRASCAAGLKQLERSCR